jgi:hypothetical protein
MPEMGYQPVNKYLPPRPKKTSAAATGAPERLEPVADGGGSKFLRWVDRVLSR